MDIVALIPARGGSKGIPKKNIKPLAGKPLISYTIEEAIKSIYIKDIFVTTDSEEIVNVAKLYKCEIIKRPKELATDEAPISDVILHSLEYLKVNKGREPDVIVLLQPTSPLRLASDIDNAIKKFLNCNKCLSLVSVTIFDPSPYLALKKENDFLYPLFNYGLLSKRRQDFPILYRPNGAIYITKPKFFYKYKTFFTPKTIAYLMPPERSIDIDTELDFLLAEILIKKRRYTLNV